MNWFEKIQRYYGWGCYNNGDVWDFVSYKKISSEQYKEITSVDYSEERTE